MVYKWKYNTPVKAETAGKELERLEQKHGIITPQIILDESRADNAPLHRLFEWDDTKAAEKYRLSQAQNIIHNLTVTIGDPETNKTVTVNAYVKTEGTYEYTPITKSVKVENSYSYVLDEAYKELEQFQRKYKNLVEFAEICKSIEATLKTANMKKAA